MPMSSPVEPTSVSGSRPREGDETLVARLALRDENALRELHRRYAALVFSVAMRYVGAASAEEVVQDVFVALWNKHGSFDPARGSFKPWLAQIARRRAMNRLRDARRDAPAIDDAIDDIASDAALPDESQWQSHRQEVIRAAVDALPEAQRQALSLAFFDELTHEQIAKVLGTPVGTAKTRIRLAMKRLGPMLLLTLGAVVALVLWKRRNDDADRDEDALRMVTASDVVPVHLAPTPAAPPDAHGSYRARPGTRVAVITTSHLPALGAGEAYVAWARGADGWQRLGSVKVEADGRSLLVVTTDPMRAAPEEIVVSREALSSGREPSGAVVLRGAL